MTEYVPSLRLSIFYYHTINGGLKSTATIYIEHNGSSFRAVQQNPHRIGQFRLRKPVRCSSFCGSMTAHSNPPARDIRAVRLGTCCSGGFQSAEPICTTSFESRRLGTCGCSGLFQSDVHVTQQFESR